MNGSRKLPVRLDGLDLGLDPLHLLLFAQFRLMMLLRLGLVFLLALLFLVLVVVLLPRILANGLVCLLVEFLQPVGFDVVVNITLKLRLVTLLVVIREGFHVLGHVPAEDVFSQRLGFELLAFNVVPRESVLRVWDQDPAVRGPLHGPKDTRPSRGARQADVQVTLKGSALLAVNLGRLGELVFAIGLLDARKMLVELELRQGTAGDEESRSVGCGPIGETVLDAVPLQFMGVRGAEYFVPRDLRRHDLDDNVPVGEAHHQSVFGRIVFVLGLRDEPLAGIVVGFAGATAFVFGLIPAAPGFDQYWYWEIVQDSTMQEEVAQRR